MSVREEFDDWAAEGRDRGMEERHWRTAKHALSSMPVEAGDTVLDFGSGSGYAARALREAADAGRAIGIDGAPEMVGNAREYTEDDEIEFVAGDFHHLPLPDDSIDHAWSMEAFYYAADPHAALAELRRVLRSGGTFYCGVNFWTEHEYSAGWADEIDLDMTRWTEAEYREAFRDAGFHVAGQTRIPDHETEIPPASEFPKQWYETREELRESCREYGTLFTVGVVP
ncbi:class I SAM-dependent methyltransferase [Salinarchaeum chitinilyticum]